MEGVFTILIVMTAVFFAIRLTGDPAVAMAPPYATAADIQELRSRLGTDKGIFQQYGIFVSNLFSLNLGESFQYKQSASRVVLDRLPNTALLAMGSLLLAITIALPLGIAWGARLNPVLSRVASAVSVLGQGIPSFWLGIVLIYIFAVQLNWFPAFGSPTLGGIVLPVLTLSVYSIPIIVRLARSHMAGVLKSDHIRTTRAMGISERRVLHKYALKNVAIPVITVLGVRISFMLGGAVVTETVFSYPGVGSLAVEALYARDFPVIQAFVLCMAILVTGINLLTDLTYGFLDPRIKIGA